MAATGVEKTAEKMKGTTATEKLTEPKMVPEVPKDDEVKDDVSRSRKMMTAGEEKRRQAEVTPLPAEVDDDEEQVDEDPKARSSQDDDEAEAKRKASSKRRLEETKSGEDDDEADGKSYANPEVANGEGHAEVKAVGKVDAGSPKRTSEKTPRNSPEKSGEEKISPALKKIIDEEVDKRMKADKDVAK